MLPSDATPPCQDNLDVFEVFDLDESWTQKEFDRATNAVRICNRCPLLEVCRKTVDAKRTENDGVCAPRAVVEAGVLWDFDAVPVSLAQVQLPPAKTADTLFDVLTLGVPSDTQWVDDWNARRDINMRAVNLLLGSSDSAAGTVSFISFVNELKEDPKAQIGSREYLGPEEVTEVLRRGAELEFTPWMLAVRLNCGWRQVARMQRALSEGRDLVSSLHPRYRKFIDKGVVAAV